jgi:hypothetical protein
VAANKVGALPCQLLALSFLLINEKIFIVLELLLSDFWVYLKWLGQLKWSFTELFQFNIFEFGSLNFPVDLACLFFE